MVGDKIRCTGCGELFIKTNRSDRCPECRKIRIKYASKAPEAAAEKREKLRAAREKKLTDAAVNAKKKGVSYGEYQAKRPRVGKAPDGYTSYKERRDQMKTTALKQEPEKEEKEPSEVPVCVKAMVSARIAEIKKELEQLEAFQATYKL